MSLPCILFDLDGTLCDHRHRLHYLCRKPKDRASYHSACVNDPPHQYVLMILNALFFSRRMGGAAIILCTGRPNTYRDITVEWLQKHCVYYDYLMMRTAKDTRPDEIVKKEMLDALRKRGYEPLFAIDDRPNIVAMFRREGVPVLAMDYKELSDVAAEIERGSSAGIASGLSAGADHDEGHMRPATDRGEFGRTNDPGRDIQQRP